MIQSYGTDPDPGGQLLTSTGLPDPDPDPQHWVRKYGTDQKI